MLRLTYNQIPYGLQLLKKKKSFTGPYYFKNITTRYQQNVITDSDLWKKAEILSEFHRKSSMPSSQRGFVSNSGNNYNAMAASPLASS